MVPETPRPANLTFASQSLGIPFGVPPPDDKPLDRLPELTSDLVDLYRDLHAHPELPGQEHPTAATGAARAGGAGVSLTTGVGGTGVAGVLTNGDGPTVMLRADMDALPGAEA